MARLKRFELLAHCLEGSCSIRLSYRRALGAGDGNRTHTTSLEGWGSTIELHPHILATKNIIPIFRRIVKYFFVFFEKTLLFISRYPKVLREYTDSPPSPPPWW